MALGWVFGKRRDVSAEAVEGKAEPQNRRRPATSNSIDPADIRLSIEDGLVMTFGPHGDPLPPQLLKETCGKHRGAGLCLPDGSLADHDRLISVLEAQQKGKLAERPSDEWVRAMLVAEGGFELAPPECLAREDSEGKTVLGGRLTLAMPGGETITLHDAHPGSARLGSPARLVVDGEPVSIEKAVCQAGLDSQGGDEAMLPSLAITQPDGQITVSFDNDVAARLETAAASWEGEAKVDLFLGDGRPVSIDDLARMLREDYGLAALLETNNVEMSYPLLSDQTPDFDLLRATVVMVSDIPEGWSLSHGLQSEEGAWMLDPSDLAKTSVQVPGSHQDTAVLTIKVLSIVGPDGSLEEQVKNVVIPPDLNQASSDAEEPPAQAPSIPLIFDAADVGSAAPAKAFLVRGIPERGSLSAGTYDSSVKGWVLKPAELDRLAILGLDHQREAIDVELTAIYLDQEGPSQADVIARKTIALGA